MTVYLVRHAEAKSRGHWKGDDRLRTLTKKGERQAKGLIHHLADADVSRVVSSPAVRCIDTVGPLATKHAVDVEVDEALFEAMPMKAALRVLLDAAGAKGDTVVCTHGDLVPEVLRALNKEGLRLVDDLRYAKGSTWVLTGNDQKLTEGRYLPPPGDP
ncbi:MAG: 8-oxo-(d)GTP phosphatase [Acidimicrobiaceae bacterium]|jgi:8-oxo-dGTP diphosphatase